MKEHPGIYYIIIATITYTIDDDDTIILTCLLVHSLCCPSLCYEYNNDNISFRVSYWECFIRTYVPSAEARVNEYDYKYVCQRYQ